MSPLCDGLFHCNVTAVSPISIARKLLGCDGTPKCKPGKDGREAQNDRINTQIDR